MLRFHLLTVGKISEDYVRRGVDEYLRRLRPYASVNWQVVAAEPVPKSLRSADMAAALRREGDRLLKHIDALPQGTHRVVLAIEGKSFTSEGLADYIRRQSLVSGSMAWIIGGALGLDPRVAETAHLKFSLSTLTFTHQLAALILLEQLYRACRINANEPYHY